MQKYFIVLAAVCMLAATANAQVEQKYSTANIAALPYWAQLMYESKPDPGKVVAEYRAYYKTHPFVKNKHTQYYKRWLRNFARTNYQFPKGSAEANQRIENEKNYLQNSQQKGGSVWQGIGPFDFDKDAESRSYAPVQPMCIA